MKALIVFWKFLKKGYKTIKSFFMSNALSAKTCLGLQIMMVVPVHSDFKKIQVEKLQSGLMLIC